MPEQIVRIDGMRRQTEQGTAKFRDTTSIIDITFVFANPYLDGIIRHVFFII